MAQSGLKYTEARGELIDGGGGDRGAGGGEVAADWPEDVLGGFTDQAYNLALLAEDEARMLGRSVVEPEHLLLAFSRRGNAQGLLAFAGVGAGDIHSAIVAVFWRGDELALGRVPRSPATKQVLRGAVVAAAARGIRGPSSEHVLLALNADARARQVLAELSVADLRPQVDRRYPVTRGPIDPDQALAYAKRASASVPPPRPGPIPPVFERAARRAERSPPASRPPAK